MIREHRIKEERRKQNELLEKVAPKIRMEGVNGYWRRISTILALVLPSYVLEKDGALKVKISGDGRNCGKRRKQVVLTVSVLSAGSISSSPHHHFTLALWEGTEDYDAFKLLLKDLLKDLEDFQNNGITLDGG